MIGGNTTIRLQASTTTKNEIGERVRAWEDAQEILGWLDLSGGDSKYTSYDSKIQESTHVFVCDYVPVAVKAENCRAVVGDSVYDVMLIDNPMNLNKQLEIFLKYTGGQ